MEIIFIHRYLWTYMNTYLLIKWILWHQFIILPKQKGYMHENVQTYFLTSWMSGFWPLNCCTNNNVLWRFLIESFVLKLGFIRIIFKIELNQRLLNMELSSSHMTNCLRVVGFFIESLVQRLKVAWSWARHTCVLSSRGWLFHWTNRAKYGAEPETDMHFI